MRKLLSGLLRLIFSDYQLNRIYSFDLDGHADVAVDSLSRGEQIRILTSQDEFTAATDERIRDHAWFLTEDHSRVYGIFLEGELLCVCCFWESGHGQMPVRFANLGAKEAAMADLLTAPECRGRGYAPIITRFAHRDYFDRGYQKLWTWVWHSNVPSIRMFQKVGWRYCYFLVELRIRPMRRFLRIKLPAWKG